MQEDLETLARRYAKTRHPDDLETLALRAWPLALREALRVGRLRNAPGNVDLDQAALDALAAVTKRYSPRKKASFKELLWLATKRRIIDQIRTIVGTKRKFQRPAMIHMSTLHDHNTEKQVQLETSSKQPPPEIRDEVDNLFTLQLTTQERVCLRTMLLCDCNFRMTGDIMGVSESRISQVMKTIRQMARARLKEET